MCVCVLLDCKSIDSDRIVSDTRTQKKQFHLKYEKKKLKS
jgi:hypothetical protein